MMEMDGGNKEDYGRCQEIFFSQVLARPKYFQPLSRNIQNNFLKKYSGIFKRFLSKNISFSSHLLIFSLSRHTVKLLVFSILDLHLHYFYKFYNLLYIVVSLFFSIERSAKHIPISFHK